MAIPFLSNKKTGAEKSAQATLGQAQGLINLLSNPNDPKFQELLAQENQSVRQGYLQNIRDLIEGNRRQALLGRQQYFDPERRDESVFSAVNQAGQQAQQQARSNVIDNLNNQIARLQGQFSGQMNLAQTSDKRNDQMRQSIMALLGGGLEAGKMFYNRGKNDFR